eukprot:12830600-Alexandrium_andersonii.AAC.1
MSASLVGSEMCIRDSSQPVRRGGRLGDQSPKRGISKSAKGARGPPKPVSYTHLTLPTICSV